MNVLRKLAWAVMLAVPGVPSSQEPRPDPGAPAPADPGMAQPASSPPPGLDEDEFEGEGWSFWPLVGRED